MADLVIDLERPFIVKEIGIEPFHSHPTIVLQLTTDDYGAREGDTQLRRNARCMRQKRAFVGRANERCDSESMTLDPASLALRIDTKAELWRSLEVVWHAGPVQPNYGKAVAAASLESSAWAGNFVVWDTGEAELETLRLADGWVVNKHYDFETGEAIDLALDELATLIRNGSSPRGALLAWRRIGNSLR